MMLKIKIDELPKVLAPLARKALKDLGDKAPEAAAKAARHLGPGVEGFVAAQVRSLIGLLSPFGYDAIEWLGDELALALTDGIKALNGDGYPGVVFVEEIADPDGVIDESDPGTVDG